MGATRVTQSAKTKDMERSDLQERRSRHDRRKVAGAAEADRLAEALERGEIEILFQPQFATEGGALIGAEALARWQHPQHMLIGGAALIEIAGQCGLTSRLSRHIMRLALEQARMWPPPLRLSLNVTAADIAEHDFPEHVALLIAQTGFPAERLTLEITEQVLLADLELSADRLRELARLGVRVALDDFGAGFCNFNYLKRLPLHYLKLDRIMVEGVDDSPRDLAVLRGIVAMAKALGLAVVAEGIERESQREAIAREGCAAWQGFLGARPMPATDFARYAAAGANG